MRIAEGNEKATDVLYHLTLLTIALSMHALCALAIQ